MPYPPATARLCVLLLAASQAAAQEAREPQAKPQERPLFRFALSDGSRIAGKFSVPFLECETEFGRLQIPVEKLTQVVIGLNHRSERRAGIEQLVRRLGDANPQRSDARAELMELGPSIRGLLREQRERATGKLQTEIDSLLDQLDSLVDGEFEENFSLLPLDTVRTERFTAVGRLAPEKFKIQTRFGDLTVTLADVERVDRSDARNLSDTHKALAVDGANLAQLGFKSSGIQVHAGDRITVRAKGTIARSASKGFSSTPDGSSRFGTFSQTPAILGGTLVAKIGPSGKIIRIGSKSSLVVKQSGLLQFAIGMRPEFVGRYQFTGQYDVTVRVLPGGR